MKIGDLDRKEYHNIPVYALGDGSDNTIPFSVYKYNNCNKLSPLHRHNVIQINYISKGHLTHRINNNDYQLVKGDIFVIPPYIPHQLISNKNEIFEIVEIEFVPEFIFGCEPNRYHEINDGHSIFDFSYIEPFLVTECNVKPRLNLTGKAQIKVEELLEEIITEFKERNDSFLMALKADLLKLLVIVGRTFHENMKNTSEMQIFNHHRDAITSALSYIDHHYNEPITIEDISKQALLSQSYFSYLFKTLTNKTFVEYLNSVRIKKAMELLVKTPDQVLQICYSCGFNSINHFNRTFKSIVGISPTEYRHLNKQNT